MSDDFNKAANEYVTVSLKDYSAIVVSGADTEAFLQGQLTCDLRNLTADNWLYGAHCDNKGKTHSVFRSVRWGDSILLIQPKSSIETSLTELRKFGVFSNVTIELLEDSIESLGMFGHAAPARVAELLQQPLSSQAQATDEHLVLDVSSAVPQFLVLTKHSEQFVGQRQASPLWEALEIENGRPWLSAETVGEFVPQMLNLHLLDGISFNKGCYIGQETIARMKYLGKQKRALFHLQGEANPATIGSTVEMQMGESWRRAGTVINAVSRSDNHLNILAVLPSDLERDTKFRLKDDDAGHLEIQSLPYPMEAS